MKKIMIVNGSPRPDGNTAVLVERLLAGANEVGAIPEVIRLQELEIQPCDGCDSCQNKSSGCVISDDMQDLYPKLQESDCIVIASPVYWFTMTAQTKAFVDRWYALISDEGFELEGKMLSLLMVYGDTDLYTSGGINMIHTLESICRYTGMDFDGIVHGSAMDIGDAAKNPELLKKAYTLGKTLASS